MASGSRTSPRIRRSAIRRPRSRCSTTHCTTRRPRTCSPRRPIPAPAATPTNSSRWRIRARRCGAARRHRRLGAHHYGWLGRSPDYKAAFLNTLGANAEFYGKFADNARAWHKRGQEAVLYLNHALVNPPIDRNKPVEQVKDVYITIQKETDAGIYVSGAKVVATNSALTQYNFLGQNMGQEITDPAMVVMFIAPMNTPASS
jgi:hypothetical protein